MTFVRRWRVKRWMRKIERRELLKVDDNDNEVRIRIAGRLMMILRKRVE